MTASVNAATIDDVKVCKHSYVLVADEWTKEGTYIMGAGELFGDGYFINLNATKTATNKGKAEPAQMITPEGGDPYYRHGEEFAKKYGEYGAHYNSLFVKNSQMVIAMKVTAKSKLIFLLQGNNKENKDARIPKIATDAKLENALNAAPTAGHPKTDANFKYEWTAPDDMTIYIGSYNGDTYIGMIIVEANEAPGTPSVKVGPQTLENGLWYREVTCKAVDMVEEGSTESIPTIVTYTTDGSAPTAASTKYTEPIKCYKDMTVKFQAFMDFGDGIADENIADGADNEANVSFSFNAPTITVDGANVAISSEYEGAKNYYKIGTDGADTEGNSVTLTESATVSAYSVITNGSYGTFTSNPTSMDAYVLNPITEKTTLKVTAGTAVIDEESTVDPKPYKIEGGEINADKMTFFVKNLEFGAVAGDAAQYQVPAGQEAYIKMNATNITFKLESAADVVVTCSKNACKNIEKDDEKKCYVNVNGTTYGTDDITANDGHIIKFNLAEAGTYTFQKYSGTGNILISSIEITPVTGDGIADINADVNDADAPAYNLAGQRVNANAKGLVIKNGKKYVNK